VSDPPEHDPMMDRRFSREVVASVVNQAAELILEDEGIFPFETSRAIATRTLIDLMVNATLVLLDDRRASLDDVMNACWQLEPDTDAATAAEMVRGWIGQIT